jgi:hypothetical protein
MRLEHKGHGGRREKIGDFFHGQPSLSSRSMKSATACDIRRYVSRSANGLAIK